jgi:hypothetical protein
MLTKDQKKEIQRFLKTGEYDLYARNWPGGPMLGGRQARIEMAKALVAEVNQRTKGLTLPAIPSFDLEPFVRTKVEPMVKGLFPKDEQEPVLSMLQRSVIFLTPANIDQILTETSGLDTIWKLANMYLCSLNAELLGKKAPRLLGLSEETTCYVSLEYFTHSDRFADFIVHEAAHVFHNCKRETVGLRETRTREFLLNIDFVQRETFAYACEAYSRILNLGESAQARLQLVSELEKTSPPPDDRVDIDRYYSALSAAAVARNGWKKIFDACRDTRKRLSVRDQIAALAR